MKINKSMGWLLVIFVMIPCMVILINLLFFPKNGDAEKYVTNYIRNSIELELGSDDKKDRIFNRIQVYTGLHTAFMRGKLSGAAIDNCIFFSDKYQKYFCFSIIPEISSQADAYYAFMREKKIVVKVNCFDLESANYGTRDNPIPIFMLEIPGVTHPDFVKRKITEEQYSRTVTFYLTWMMSKKEFKQRFSSTNNN